MATPPRPDRFHPSEPPPGFVLKLVSFWQERRHITPRLQLVHTNAASQEGSIDASWRWSQRNTEPGAIHGNPVGSRYYTIPHFQVDRDGSGAMFLPLDRQSITNARANPFSIGIETADSGTLADPTISAFTDKQAETVAVALAYAAWGYQIPLEYPAEWDGTGSACHTEPFGYPYWTSFNGKICPGSKKKAQVRDVILPRARAILFAWTELPAPPEDDDMKRYLARLDTSQYHYRVGDGVTANVLRSNEYVALKARFDTNNLPAEAKYFNPHTGNQITAWNAVPVLNETQLDLDVGYVSEAGKADEG